MPNTELPDLPEPILRTLFDCETQEDWHSEHWAVWELRYGDAEHCPEWRDHKDAILRAWVADHPGTRPSIWWRLATPEERPEGESQASFLRRHRLFLRGEERRVPAGAYEPEPVDADEGRGDAA